jgi:cytochrome P450
MKTALDVPGPRMPRVAQTWMGVTRPIEARLEMRERYGPVFRTTDALAGTMIHVADRALVEQMFKWKPAQYTVAGPREIMKPVTGASSILLLDGDRHLRMRKLMLPPFHGEAITHYGGVVESITNREVDRWRPGTRIRMRTLAQTITMEVIIRAVFGVSDPARIGELKRLMPGLSSPSPALLLLQRDLGRLSPWGRFVRRRDRVDALLYEEIDRRRHDPGEDVLTLLLSARDEDGNPLTDRELRDELITLLLAGYETTATSIAWAFERLLRSPAALQRLTDEVRAGESSEYLDAVIKETLRVRPVISEVFRAPSEPVELGGYRFDPGTQLAAAILLVQYDPQLYGPDPLEFRPERFLEGATEAYTWIPFGGGVRRCLGATFAQLEMRVVLAAVLRRATLRAPRDKSEAPRFRGITINPARGGEAVVESVA